MIEIPERVMEILEAQAPSITDETLSKHDTKRNEEKEKELSRVGVVEKSKKIQLNFRGQLPHLHLRSSCPRSPRQWRGHFEHRG